MSMFRDFSSAAKGNNAPATVGIVVAMVACFVFNWVSRGGLIQPLAFFPVVALSRPWTFFTYPFAIGDPLSALFLSLWLWGIGGSVERELGSLKFGLVWLIFSFLSAFCVWTGTLILRVPATDVLAGGWTAVTSITVIWATRNPNVQVLFMFVIPLAAKWLAWISIAFVFFATAPELAPFAAIPFALAYLFAANRLPFAPYSRGASYGGATKKWERYNKTYYEEVQRREKERDEKERLRKLFEGSLDDDPEKDR